MVGLYITSLIQGSIVDTLELYAPALNGLLEVHAFATDQLEILVFDKDLDEESAVIAATLYGDLMIVRANPRPSYGNVEHNGGRIRSSDRVIAGAK